MKLFDRRPPATDAGHRDAEKHGHGSPEEYCAVTTEALPVGRGEAWVYDPRNGRCHGMEESSAGLLPLLSRFRTLEEHAQILLESGWQDDGSGYLRSALRKLVDTGLLVGKSDFLGALRGADLPDEARPAITSLCWTTRGRLDLLRRSVESYVDSTVACGRRLNFKVFDDTASRADRVDVCAMLSELARTKQVPVWYAGEEEKRTFARTLERELGTRERPPGIPEFACFDPFGLGSTFGANMNALLLDTREELTIKVDDDTLCRFAAPPGPLQGVALCSASDPTEIRFLSSGGSPTQAAPPGEVDVVTAHEALLGQPVAGCLRDLLSTDLVDCRELRSEHLPMFESGTARVAVTMTGVRGDSGMSSPRYFLTLTGDSRVGCCDPRSTTAEPCGIVRYCGWYPVGRWLRAGCS